MNDGAASPPPAVEPRMDRLQPWLAAAASVVLHLLLLLLLLMAEPPPVVTQPQGASSAGRIRVDFVGRPQPGPPSPEVREPEPAPADAAPPRELDARELADPRRVLLPAQPEPQPQPPRPQPQPRPRTEPSPRTASQPSAPVTAPTRAPPHPWNGRPPGMVEEDVESPDNGRNAGIVDNGGAPNQVDTGGEPAMDVGGYQVIYELLGERKLRDWIEQGMTEVAIPLPGTRHFMVCPAEVALRRGASKCRMVDPASPEMIGIGDAREVISVRYVYHLGKLVWRGPGPYR